MKLSTRFYENSTLDVARDLLGKFLVRSHPDGKISGRIVETEAYVGVDDKASHASRGRTPRSSIMFGPAGFAYVYLIYGFYHCLNLVTDRENYPAAVLIRAVEPAEGIELMRKHRRVADARNLTNGPGKLCQAFAIDRSFNGTDLRGDVLYVEDRSEIPPLIAASPRVGVDYAGEWKDKLWRFFIQGHRYVSKG